MKKILSFLLCVMLLVSTGITAFAAPVSSDSAMTERLTAVTQKVKNTLGIGDAFTSFNGNLTQSGSVSLWSLSWSSDKEQIYVNANENGTIISYNDNLAGNGSPSNSKLPKFPSMSLEDAKSAAAGFLSKVLDTKIASVSLTGNSSLDYSGNAVYYLNGPLKLYGIETPVSIGISVSAATKQVSSFYRSDNGQDYSGVTNPSAAADKAAAAAALKGTLNMKMTYALPGDGTHNARLLYQPNPDGSYVIDAATGKLVDLSKLDYGNDSGYGYSGKTASAPAPESDAGITPVEQASIDKLQGVLSQSDLESIVRGYPELGLSSDFKLRNINYYTYQDDKKATQVTANLQFTYAPKDSDMQYRNVTMDAKAGKLISVNGSLIYAETKNGTPTYTYSSTQTEAVARSFAGKLLPDELKMTSLSSDATGPAFPDSVQYFMFSRVNEGIPFPENYISVGVDKNTGFVVNFYYNWYDYDVTFVSPKGAISTETAASKYAEGTGLALKYVAVPASVQPSGLMLAYTRDNTSVWGVNALTGELLKPAPAADTALKYDDLGGNPYADTINKLASYGIGFPGGSFKPSAQLTQQDALILIESANGRTIVPIPLASPTVSAASGDGKVAALPVGPSETDDIYNMAYSMGILTPDEKDPSKLVSRAEFVKYLVNALGYGEVARLQGIFKPGFTDDSAIPTALLGYVAIGKGLGIIHGDDAGKFKPNEISNRTTAALMLYNCMNRK